MSSLGLAPRLRKGICQPGKMKIECAKDKSICVVNQSVKYDGVANLFEQGLGTEEVSIEYCLNEMID